jgi:hypothetical protein
MGRLVSETEKKSTLPPRRKFLPSGGEEAKKNFLIKTSGMS